MEPSVGRFGTGAVWSVAVLAIACAASEGAVLVAASWSVPVALAVTFAALGWPGGRLTRVLTLIGLVWQAALVVTYLPVGAIRTAWNGNVATLPMPFQAFVIAVVLCLLALAFLLLFVFPAVSLGARLQRMTRAIVTQGGDEDAVLRAIRGDATLTRAWREYVSHLTPTAGPAGGGLSSRAAARLFFNLQTVVEARLRLDFFRHLPGVLTGIGIIGTFSGLIVGLRSFRISEDASVVQASLNGLLQGVWESFLISAGAILLAVLVTLVEKTFLAWLARRLELLARSLDAVFPLRIQEPERGGSVDTGALEMIAETLRVAMSKALPALTAAAPQGDPYATNGARAAGGSLAINAAMEETLGRLNGYLAEHSQSMTQSLQMSSQVLKSVSSRLEGVASGIEVSGRRTLEAVSARLLDAQMSLSARQQATSEQIAELVGRLESVQALMMQGGASELPDSSRRGTAPAQYEYERGFRNGDAGSGSGGERGGMVAPGWPPGGQALMPFGGQGANYVGQGGFGSPQPFSFGQSQFDDSDQGSDRVAGGRFGS
jgi:hypothetical protein